MGSIFKSPNTGPSAAQQQLEASQLREDRRLSKQEAARRSALRRRRSGRSSLISGDTDAGIKNTLGGS